MELHELDSLLESARRPEKKVRLNLRGDLQAQWEELNEKLSRLVSQSGRKLAGQGEETELSQQIRNLESEMEASSLTLTLRAMTRHEWSKLLREHPEREGDEQDKALGVNVDTFFDALVSESIVDPELDDERAARLLEGLTGAQYSKLTEAAWGLNRKDVDIPFSQLASRVTETSGDTQKPRQDSGSRSGGSKAGNRKK